VKAQQSFGFVEPSAHARAQDPDTSHAAAASVRHISESQQHILRLFRLYGPMTDEQLLAKHREWQRRYGDPLMSDSGVRTRRSELVVLGRVRDSGKRERLSTGRKAIVWEVTDGRS
jgi:hypothetical protein